MRGYITAVLLGGLLSLSRADIVKTKDGQSYHGTVQYRDADSIKLQPADSGEVEVFLTDEVEEVQVDSPACQPARPANPVPPRRLHPEFWEQQGYADAIRAGGIKSALAGTGGCIGAPVGAYLGSEVPSGAGCLIGAAAGGAAGCLAGNALGSTAQAKVTSPVLDSVCREAYLRGYQRGVRHSDVVALATGAGAAVASTIVCVLLLVWAITSSIP